MKTKQANFNKDNFKHAVITDARDYQLQHNPEAKEIAERMKFSQSING